MISASLGQVRDTGTAKGRGVFASRDIRAGEVVETCPVLLLGTRLSALPEALNRVVFDWGYLLHEESSFCVALGWGSMYNHSNPANMSYLAHLDSQTLAFVAVRDIRKLEELTINYNQTRGGISSERDVWFEVKGIQPLP